MFFKKFIGRHFKRHLFLCLFLALQVSVFAAEPRKVPPEFWADFLRVAGITGPLPGSLVEATGLIRLPWEKVHLLSYRSYLGDTVLFGFSVLNGIQSTFPTTPLHVTSPLVDILRAQRGLILEPMRLPEVIGQDVFSQIERYATDTDIQSPVGWKWELEPFLGKMLAPLQHPTTLYYVDASYLDGEIANTVIRRRLRQKLPFDKRSNERIAQASSWVAHHVKKAIRDHLKAIEGTAILTEGGLAEVYSWNKNLTPAQRSLIETSHQESGHQIWDKWKDLFIGRSRSNYEVSGMQSGVLFGTPVDFHIPATLLKMPAEENAWRAFLSSSFRSQDGPLLVLNLNTAGTFKTAVIGPKVDAALEAILRTVHSVNPRTRIIVTPLENPSSQHYAEEQKAIQSAYAKAEAFLKKYQEQTGKLAFLPAEPDLKPIWYSAMKEASAIITQDSGFLHMANLHADFQKTLVLGTDQSTLAWVKPGQAVLHDFYTNEAKGQLALRSFLEPLLDPDKGKESSKSVERRSLIRCALDVVFGRR